MDASELSRLYDGFARRDPRISAEFFELLIRAVRREVVRWKTLVHRYDEVESGVRETLVEWLVDGLLRHDEPIEGLASRLVKQVARQEKREMLREREGQRELAAAAERVDPRPDALAEAEGSELLALFAAMVSGLPLKQQQVLEARLASERGGPPVPEALGMPRGTASKLLSQARAALLERMVARKLELPEEWRALLLGAKEEADGG